MHAPVRYVHTTTESDISIQNNVFGTSWVQVSIVAGWRTQGKFSVCSLVARGTNRVNEPCSERSTNVCVEILRLLPARTGYYTMFGQLVHANPSKKKIRTPSRLDCPS